MGNKPDRQKRIELKANREVVTERAGLLPDQLGDLREGLGLKNLSTKRIGATPLKARGKDRNANPANPNAANSAAGMRPVTATARAAKLDRTKGKPGSKKAAATRAAALQAKTEKAQAAKAQAQRDKRNAATRARRAAKKTAGAKGAPKRK